VTVFLFTDLNTYSAPLGVGERHGSDFKQLTLAIGMAIEQSYYSRICLIRHLKGIRKK